MLEAADAAFVAAGDEGIRERPAVLMAVALRAGAGALRGRSLGRRLRGLCVSGRLRPPGGGPHRVADAPVRPPPLWPRLHGRAATTATVAGPRHARPTPSGNGGATRVSADRPHHRRRPAALDQSADSAACGLYLPIHVAVKSKRSAANTAEKHSPDGPSCHSVTYCHPPPRRSSSTCAGAMPAR